MSSTFALVDCNNFYASCEKLFRPDLKHVPIVVLSSNDGCVVARSKEAKALGIKMAVPLFQIQEMIREHNIQVFSSNYALYADLSSRVMQTLHQFASSMEVYSIDESFLDLTGFASEALLQHGQQIKATVLQWTGIDVCIGIAPTKTLAKLANYAAKKYPATGGVVDLSDRNRQKRLLGITPVEEIWGVGRKIASQLQSLGISTALDLANYPAAVIRKQFSVVLERTALELNGISCLALEEIPPTKKQIVCSRSFGTKVTKLEQMRGAIAQYTARACEKLRKEGQQAKSITVFVQTSPFSQREPSYSNSTSGQLCAPSCDSRDITQLAMQLLEHIWRDGYSYSKGGVMLTDFWDTGSYQPGLFDAPIKRANDTKLMSVVDEINRRGLGRIQLASEGLGNAGAMKRESLSPSYTTRWLDLPTVN